MKDIIRLAVSSAAIAGALLTGTQLVQGTPAEAGIHRYSWDIPTRPCAAEDSRNCFWDAGARGNHRGHSFWVGRGGKVHYLDPRLGR